MPANIFLDYAYSINYDFADEMNSPRICSIKLFEETCHVKFFIGKNNTGNLITGPLVDNKIFELVFLTNKVKKFISSSKNFEEIIENKTFREFYAGDEGGRYLLSLRMKEK